MHRFVKVIVVALFLGLACSAGPALGEAEKLATGTPAHTTDARTVGPCSALAAATSGDPAPVRLG